MEKWTMVAEKNWLRAQSDDVLRGYLRALPRRAVDFDGNDCSAGFRAELRRHAERAIELWRQRSAPK